MNIHFIGIGGIGVSALARYYAAKGNRVTGSDLAESEITQALKKQGVRVFIGPHAAKNVPINADVVVHSPAVQKDNPELREARKRQMKILSYPSALGELTKTHYTIAVSGTHGKSTTTAMLGLLLTKAGLDPTVIVGTKLKEFGNSNVRVGGPARRSFSIGGTPHTAYSIPNTEYLVIEADEHFASFLHYRPQMIVLTTIEEDHLDYYKNLGNIMKTFLKYVGQLPKDGWLVCNEEDKNTQQLISKIKNQKSKVQFPPSLLLSLKLQRTKRLRRASKIQEYSINRQREADKLRAILKVPGEHNVANALAALTAGRILGIPDETSFKALSQYKGAWRRFEIFNLKKPVPYTLVSDYGHHPTEIKVTVEAARQKWPDKKIWLVYQPHQYQRTYYLFDDFTRTLARLPIDTLILADIYDVAGREETQIRNKVSSKKLADSILNTQYSILNTVLHIPSIKEMYSYLVQNIKRRDVVLVMGAGNIYNLTLMLTGQNEKKTIKSGRT
ncbi:MAG: UDP-N-acetylmuramate--L-alanine ligase [Candidatus Wildermuthbacteria bacterium]|nr:UDP-N-acetylmuramate--L-alanine ligase [Candidatus Wildermuthbacteria bacterium]